MASRCTLAIVVTSSYLFCGHAVEDSCFSNIDSEACLQSTPGSTALLQGSKTVRHLQAQLPYREIEEGKTVDASLYLDQVRDTITGTTMRTPSIYPSSKKEKTKPYPFVEKSRWRGNAWCVDCFSMAGGARVQNVRELVEETIANHVPGDFLEAGSWRGGISIMARVVQKAMGEGDTRNTYVCDSFAGLPKASNRMDTDRWADQKELLAVSQEEVQDNFKRFHALDENVKFRKGFFVHSLPKVKEELSKEGRTLAVLRGDGDMYESYMDILYNMYDFLEVGGYFICDDCRGIREADNAIEDFRKQNGISEPIQSVVDSAMGTFWKKEGRAPINYTWYLEWNATRVLKQ